MIGSLFDTYVFKAGYSASPIIREPLFDGLTAPLTEGSVSGKSRFTMRALD